ncbi:MAG: hypothetical protein Q8J93_07530 [Xanthomonadales bacterium]|nr:hypothetical protein [Xanthomonadales bacterium]MDZ4378667.1 hypothetical protein [Xanthomonadaceae bacterium]
MKHLVVLVLASLIVLAPESLAQMPAKRLSADGTCLAPAQDAKPGAPADAVIAPKEPAAAATRDCAQCDSHYHVPTRWHRFLPGMFR